MMVNDPDILKPRYRLIRAADVTPGTTFRRVIKAFGRVQAGYEEMTARVVLPSPFKLGRYVIKYGEDGVLVIRADEYVAVAA